MITLQHQLIGQGASAITSPARGGVDISMAARDEGQGSMNASNRLPLHYRISIHGHLDPAWSDWFEGLAIVQEADGTTTLAGPLADQAAVYGLLSRLRDLGATLLTVEKMAIDDP
jgi:hypothetical protein